MTKTEVTKLIVNNVVAYTTSFTIANLIRCNLRSESRVQNAEIWVGSVVVGMMVSDHAQKYVDNGIDEVIDWYQTNFKK